MTGGAGMIGQAIVLALHERADVEVRVADSRDPPEWMAQDAELFSGDLRDTAPLRAPR